MSIEIYSPEDFDRLSDKANYLMDIAREIEDEYGEYIGGLGRFGQVVHYGEDERMKKTIELEINSQIDWIKKNWAVAATEGCEKCGRGSFVCLEFIG